MSAETAERYIQGLLTRPRGSRSRMIGEQLALLTGDQRLWFLESVMLEFPSGTRESEIALKVWKLLTGTTVAA